VSRNSLFCFTVLGAALFGGCSQAADETASSNSDTSTADTLLGGVQGCMTQSSCAADAGAYGGSQGCSQLHACLSGLVPNGAGIALDGGISGGLPGIGGGFPGIGGLPGIGSGLPGIGNGIPGIGNPLQPSSGDGGASAAIQCLTDLGMCLKAQSSPATCAQQAIACLKAAKQGGIL
jgi:hypothetical protein